MLKAGHRPRPGPSRLGLRGGARRVSDQHHQYAASRPMRKVGIAALGAAADDEACAGTQDIPGASRQQAAG